MDVIDVDVLAAQEERQAAAAEILAGLGLLERWSAFARPVPVGAMSYGLMVAPDIDLEVFHEGDPPIEEAFGVLAACAMHPAVTKVRFSNHLADADQGLYCQVRIGHGSEDWKIDMWLLSEEHPGPLSSWLVQPMRTALTDDTRRAILTVKSFLATDPGLRCGSIHVYRAVLEDGVRTPEQFQDWRLDHDTASLTDWRPSAAGPI